VSGDLDHLFRRESGRIVATLTRIFGMHNLALAEDVVQEAFCRALEVWKFSDVPQNPSAWLTVTARNCALDALRRQRTADSFAPALSYALESAAAEELFGPAEARDDLLRMMFSCCHPRVSETGQIALILHILCGFSVEEVAGAFLQGPAAMEKRIARAKKVLADSRHLFDVTAAREFVARLPVVQSALYLLFNEGYHGASADSAVHAELCAEALRLTAALLEHPLGATPTSYALAALMCLNGARLPARLDAAGDLYALPEQDRARWDARRIAEGFRFLALSARGTELSPYHIEAAIAALHASAPSAASTDWTQIAALYDTLITIQPSPIVALNRAIAIAQSEGAERGLAEIGQIVGYERLSGYPFHAAALGELELRCGRRERARDHFSAALSLARNPTEQRFITQRIRACEQ
jgi:RNA polymerase sigma-70 factor (ECF subfamily)